MSYRPKKIPGPSKLDPNTLEDNSQAERNTIYNLVANMYLKSEFSDLIIVCKGREFAAHKFVVCQRSEHLNGLCESHQVFGFLKLMLLVSIANTVSLQNPSKPLVINREPILIEKTLEFLYQADYTVLNATPTKNFKNLKAPQSTVASSIRTFRKAQLAKLRAAEETAGDELVEISPERQTDGVDDEGEKNILGDDDPFLKECHPCYFHARMYGEGDCLRIQDLKAKAKSHFKKTFMDNPDATSFSKTIEEIYSNRAVYAELRTLAIHLIVQNLKTLWLGSNPVLDRDLIKSVPEFTSDLLLAVLDLGAFKNIFGQLADQKPADVAKKSLKTEIPKRA
ncbi:hypothetical protein N7450_007006 [Penicillium hetheringtonii]|uniref:BTB domain-containing protein n=1 Tax=Penicillium hetheringtonii TaxID=911720 RepID=A0AAD6GS76_9EURO|nr:hypothetical protein N7450_007006 [Penicillium hetheringtonii]